MYTEIKCNGEVELVLTANIDFINKFSNNIIKIRT